MLYMSNIFVITTCSGQVGDKSIGVAKKQPQTFVGRVAPFPLTELRPLKKTPYAFIALIFGTDKDSKS